MLITAHSGAEGTRDNSREYLRLALSLACDAFEVDVRKIDGVLYCTHDATADVEGLCTLEECFARMAEAGGAKMCNLDMKEEDIAPMALALAEKRGLSRRLVFTGSVSDADARAIGRAGAAWWMNCTAADTMAEEARARGAKWVNIPLSLVTGETVSLLHARGVRVSAWTANTAEEIRRLRALSADNVTTRFPSLARD